MASVINSLTIVLESARSLPNKPVIIIDFVEVLMEEWHDDPGHKQLHRLLDFFVSTTKKQLAHIVLASAEPFVVEFLQYGKLLKFPLEIMH